MKSKMTCLETEKKKTNVCSYGEKRQRLREIRQEGQKEGRKEHRAGGMEGGREEK